VILSIYGTLHENQGARAKTPVSMLKQIKELHVEATTEYTADLQLTNQCQRLTPNKYQLTDLETQVRPVLGPLR
jgi:hypothetical protein